MKEVMTILCLVIFFSTFLMSGIYNFHMFQQNTYSGREEIDWLIKFNSRERVLLLDLLSGLLAITGLKVFEVIFALTMLLTLWYFNAMEDKSSKKKLVWTDRMKRLFDTYLILGFIIFFLAAWLGTFARGLAFLLMTLALLLSPLIIILANIINSPLEKAVRNYYINDARRILKSMPEMKIIGITGSYGKTSVKYYLETLLKSKFNVVKTPESYNTPMGVVKTIRSDIRKGTQIFLCEMGARKVGEIKEICDIVHPHDGILTSIGPQHLETFHSIENIIHTKFELGDALPDDGLLFLNGDNEYIRNNSDKYANKTFYGSDESVKKLGRAYYTKDIRLGENGTEFTIVSPDGQEQRYAMKLLGTHNVLNVAGAIAVANTYGIDLKDLVVPVRRLRPAPHRLQMIGEGNTTIIDDAYNSNPAGSKAAVETLGMFEGTRILITPGMVELGEKEDELNKKFGTYAAANSDYVCLVGEKHTRPILAGLLEAGFPRKNIFIGETLDEAMAYARSREAKGRKYILLENDLPDVY